MKKSTVESCAIRKCVLLSMVFLILVCTPVSAKLKEAGNTIVYVGDSRFARMYRDQHIHSKGDVFRFSQNSITSQKYMDEIMPSLCQYLNRRKHVIIVASIGINDLRTMSLSMITAGSPQVRSVCKLYRTLIQKYAKAPYHDCVFIKSVDPTGTEGYPRLGYNNSKVRKLNKLVRRKFGRYYMNSYSFIWKLTGGKIDPYTTDTGNCAVNGHDGLHYNKKTNLLLHRWIRHYVGME